MANQIYIGIFIAIMSLLFMIFSKPIANHVPASRGIYNISLKKFFPTLRDYQGERAPKLIFYFGMFFLILSIILIITGLLNIQILS